MEAILACHPARSTEWLDCHPKSCELCHAYSHRPHSSVAPNQVQHLYTTLWLICSDSESWSLETLHPKKTRDSGSKIHIQCNICAAGQRRIFSCWSSNLTSVMMLIWRIVWSIFTCRCWGPVGGCSICGTGVWRQSSTSELIFDFFFLLKRHNSGRLNTETTWAMKDGINVQVCLFSNLRTTQSSWHSQASNRDPSRCEPGTLQPNIESLNRQNPKPTK